MQVLRTAELGFWVKVYGTVRPRLQQRHRASFSLASCNQATRLGNGSDLGTINRKEEVEQNRNASLICKYGSISKVLHRMLKSEKSYSLAQAVLFGVVLVSVAPPKRDMISHVTL